MYSQRCCFQAQSNSVHIMKLARLYVCTMTSVLFFSSNSIGKTEQNTFLWLLCSFCCSHACFCDDDRVSSFNIQLTTSITSLDLIRCPSPFSLSLCFLFAIQYVRMISYGVLCFNRLRECPRGLQRPWLIFFFCFFRFVYSSSSPLCIKEKQSIHHHQAPKGLHILWWPACCVCTIL